MRLALSFALILSLSGCSTVKIWDDLWCADAGKFGAECFSTISNTEMTLNKYEWDKRRLGQICSATLRPGEGYTHIEVALEKLCSDSSFCSPEQRASIDRITQRVDEAMKASEDSTPFSGSDPANSAGMETQTIQELGLQPEK